MWSCCTSRRDGGSVGLSAPLLPTDPALLLGALVYWRWADARVAPVLATRARGADAAYDGLLRGLQQLAARQQLEQMRQLPPGAQVPGMQPGPQQPVPDERSGTYL